MKREIVAFVANDANRYAFVKALSCGMISTVVTIGAETAKKNGVSNYLDVRKDIETFGSNIVRIIEIEKYRLDNEKDLESIRLLEPCAGLVLGWNRLLSSEVISIFKAGVFGFHGTPFGLPKGRGRSPSIWSIALGYKEFRYHMFEIDSGIDSGVIVDTIKIEIHEKDNIRSFHQKLSYAAWKMIEKNLEKIISGGVTFGRQLGKPIYFRKRTEKDGVINWHRSTESIYNLVRAIARPYPGAITNSKTGLIKVWDSVPFDDMPYASPAVCGTVLFSSDEGFAVRTGTGALLVTDFCGSVPTEGEILG